MEQATTNILRIALEKIANENWKQSLNFICTQVQVGSTLQHFQPISWALRLLTWIFFRNRLKKKILLVAKYLRHTPEAKLIDLMTQHYIGTRIIHLHDRNFLIKKYTFWSQNSSKQEKSASWCYARRKRQEGCQEFKTSPEYMVNSMSVWATQYHFVSKKWKQNKTSKQTQKTNKSRVDIDVEDRKGSRETKTTG